MDDSKKISELTVGEFKILMDDVLNKIFKDFEQNFITTEKKINLDDEEFYGDNGGE